MPGTPQCVHRSLQELQQLAEDYLTGSEPLPGCEWELRSNPGEHVLTSMAEFPDAWDLLWQPEE